MHPNYFSTVKKKKKDRVQDTPIIFYLAIFVFPGILSIFINQIPIRFDLEKATNFKIWESLKKNFFFERAS